MKIHRTNLIRLIERLGDPRNVVEVGVWRGHTSAAILDHFPDLTMTMVDPWDEPPEEYKYRRSRWVVAQCDQAGFDSAYEEARKVTQFAANRRRIMKMPSVQAAGMMADNTLDLVFIDGDHSYEAVIADNAAWWPRIKSGGILAGHDWNDRSDVGVKQAVNEFAKEHNIEVHNEAGMIWWVRKADVANG